MEITKRLDTYLRDLSEFRETVEKLHYYAYKRGITGLNEFQAGNLVANEIIDKRLTEELKKLNFEKFEETKISRHGHDNSKWYGKPPKVNYGKPPKVKEITEILINNEKNFQEVSSRKMEKPSTAARYYIEGICLAPVKQYFMLSLSDKNCVNLNRYLYGTGTNPDIAIVGFIEDSLSQELTSEDLDRITKIRENIEKAKQSLMDNEEESKKPKWARSGK